MSSELLCALGCRQAGGGLAESEKNLVLLDSLETKSANRSIVGGQMIVAVLPWEYAQHRARQGVPKMEMMVHGH